MKSPSGEESRRPVAMTRRSAVLATASLGLGLVAARSVAAQSATPQASEISYLFVLAGFTSGTFTANDDGSHELALSGTPEQIVYFADRPGREVGTVPTGHGLEILGIEGDDPPNAALVITLDDGTTDTVVLELTAYSLDATAGSLTFTVTVLGSDALGEDGMGLAEEPLPVETIPASFGSSSLFIDNLGCSPWDPRC